AAGHHHGLQRHLLPARRRPHRRARRHLAVEEDRPPRRRWRALSDRFAGAADLQLRLFPICERTVAHFADYRATRPMASAQQAALLRRMQQRRTAVTVSKEGAMSTDIVLAGSGCGASSVGNERSRLPPRALRRVCDYVEAHLEETINLQVLAEIAGKSMHH